MRIAAAAIALLVGLPCAAAPTPKIPKPVERWRVAVPGLDVEAALLRPDGSVWVAAEFDEPLKLPGGGVLSSAGDDDIALLVLGPDGALRAAHGLGGSGAEAAHGLVESGGVVLLGATTRGALTVGGRTVRAPAGASAYLPGVSGLVIALGADGRPTGVPIVQPHAESMALAALPGGGLLVGHQLDRMREGPQGAVVTRHDGERVGWRRSFDGLDLMRVDGLGGQALVALGGRNMLAVHRLDGRTGADAAPRTTLSTPFTGDRGAVSAIVEGLGGLRMVGYSGRPPVRGEAGESQSHSIEPFSLRLGRAGGSREQVVDAVASVAAVGRIGGELATVIDVIHTGPRYGGRSPPHPGTWLTIGLGSTLRLVPIHLRGGGAQTGIDTIRPRAGSVVDGDRVVLVGRCDAAGRIGCIVRLALR